MTESYYIIAQHCGADVKPVVKVGLFCPHCKHLIRWATEDDLLAENVKKQIDPDYRLPPG